MQTPTDPLPHFISLEVTPVFQLIVNNAVATDIKSYPMKLVMRDVYGDAASIYFTLIVEASPVSPPHVAECWTHLGVAPVPFVTDLMYLPGSVKEAQIHMNPKPISNNGIDCQDMLVLQADWVMSSTPISYVRLPWFMWLDSTYRRVKIYLPKADSTTLIGSNYDIRVRAYIKGNEADFKQYVFKVAIIDA
jgi:hypothetical protein